MESMDRLFYDEKELYEKEYFVKRQISSKDDSDESSISAYTLNRTEVTTVAMWVEVVGTIISALGNTPSLTFISTELANNLNLVGDTIQVSGTTIQIEDETNLTLNKIGNIIQDGGNIEEIAGYLIPMDLTKLRTLIQTQGNAIQLLGILLSFIFTKIHPTLSSVEEAYGTMIQIIGLGMQTLSGGFPSSSEFGQNLNTTGNWVQVVGAILQALGQTLHLEEQYYKAEEYDPSIFGGPPPPLTVRFYEHSNGKISVLNKRIRNEDDPTRENSKDEEN
ncbi:MAG: DUF6944 family repetitive protein [Bacillus sp. (in: firmicutes)]